MHFPSPRMLTWACCACSPQADSGQARVVCSKAYTAEQIKNLMERIDMVTSVVSTVTVLIWSVIVVQTGSASTPEPEGIPDGPTQKWTVHQFIYLL